MKSTTLPFVIPSEAEGSAVRPSALPNFPYQTFHFTLRSVTKGAATEECFSSPWDDKRERFAHKKTRRNGPPAVFVGGRAALRGEQLRQIAEAEQFLHSGG